MTTKSEFIHTLSKCSPESLREIVRASGYSNTSNSAPDLAQFIGQKLWWHSHSPIKQWIQERELQDILEIYGKKLDLQFQTQDPWTKLQELTNFLIPPDQPIHIAVLPEELQQRLINSAWPKIAGMSGVGVAAGTHSAARWLLKITKGKWADIIKYIPKLGPILMAIRSFAGWTAIISAPVGIALGLWTVNSSLGPRWDKALTLLLGCGLALRAEGQTNRLSSHT